MRYALLLQDDRCAIELPFYWIYDEPVRGRSGSLPDGPHLSSSEITEVTEAVLRSLTLEGASTSRDVGPFYHVVASNLVVYGYEEGEFFARGFATQEQFYCACRDLDARMAGAERKRGEDFIEALFASCGTPIVA